MRTMRRRCSFVTFLALAALAGCNTLPSSGPPESVIVDRAKDPRTNPLGFKIVDISPAVVGILAAEPAPTISTLDRIGSRVPDPDRIGPGDTLSIAILELGSALFAGGAGAGANPLAGAPAPSSAVTTETLPPVTVDAAGRVDIPYVGRLAAAGRTAEQLAAAIEAGLRGKSQNPQVVVRITTDLANSIIIYGDLHKPGRVPLTLAHERLLDAIALAGGPDSSPEDTEVRITRDGVTGDIPLRTLEEDPAQNIGLRPGDRVEVLFRPRTFTVFGATSKVSEVNFNVANLSLADALARIGGPLDDRADPNAVFLFRFEDRAAARALGVPGRPTAASAPVLYRLDMMDPTSYFLAQRFAMKNQDLVYIANAKTNPVYKFMSLVNLLTGPGISAAYLSTDH